MLRSAHRTCMGSVPCQQIGFRVPDTARGLPAARLGSPEGRVRGARPPTSPSKQRRPAPPPATGGKSSENCSAMPCKLVSRQHCWSPTSRAPNQPWARFQQHCTAHSTPHVCQHILNLCARLPGPFQCTQAKRQTSCTSVECGLTSRRRPMSPRMPTRRDCRPAVVVGMAVVLGYAAMRSLSELSLCGV